MTVAGEVNYSVELTHGVLEALKKLDRRARESILSTIERLQTDPVSRGQALTDSLSGYRSHRAAGQRYRIIFTVNQESNTVTVVLVGIRKEGDKRDVYALAQRLVRLGLLRE